MQTARDKGQTLVELLVSFTILGFVIGCILALLPFAHVFNRNAWNTNTASDVAASQMNQLRATDFAKLPSTFGPLVVTDAHGTAYTCSGTVQPYRAYTTMKLATVVVQWSQSGGQKQMVLHSLLPNLTAP